MVGVPGSFGPRAFSALLTTASLALLLAFSSPVGAQDSSASPSPGASQYNVVGDGADVGAIPPAISDNVTGGADAVNEAMKKDDEASPAEVSPPEVSPSAGAAEEERPPCRRRAVPRSRSCSRVPPCWSAACCCCG